MYTIDDFIKMLLAICGGISIIAAAIGWIYKGVKKVKEPTDKIHQELQKHKERMDEQDEKIKKIDEYLIQDRKEIKEINQGNKIVQKSLLAIMEQFLSDGTDKTRLKDTKEELENYLIDK